MQWVVTHGDTHFLLFRHPRSVSNCIYHVRHPGHDFRHPCTNVVCVSILLIVWVPRNQYNGCLGVPAIYIGMHCSCSGLYCMEFCHSAVAHPIWAPATDLGVLWANNLRVFLNSFLLGKILEMNFRLSQN